MSSVVGHIKLSRKMFDGLDDFWSEDRVFSRAEAWIDLMQLASFKRHKRLVGNQFVELERGEVLASVRFLADRWRWGRDRVWVFLNLIEDTDRIRTVRRTSSGTVYRLVKYEDYQSVADSKQDTEPDANRTENRTPTGQVPDESRTKRSKEVQEVPGSKPRDLLGIPMPPRATAVDSVCTPPPAREKHGEKNGKTRDLTAVKDELTRTLERILKNPPGKPAPAEAPAPPEKPRYTWFGDEDRFKKVYHAIAFLYPDSHPRSQMLQTAATVPKARRDAVYASADETLARRRAGNVNWNAARADLVAAINGSQVARGP